MSDPLATAKKTLELCKALKYGPGVEIHDKCVTTEEWDIFEFSLTAFPELAQEVLRLDVECRQAEDRMHELIAELNQANTKLAVAVKALKEYYRPQMNLADVIQEFNRRRKMKEHNSNYTGKEVLIICKDNGFLLNVVSHPDFSNTVHHDFQAVVNQLARLFGLVNVGEEYLP